jgi:glycosyltransferase involved in cell wall biosynthesis
VARSGIDNFHMLGRIPKSAVQSFLSRLDGLAVSFYRSPLYRFGASPNKLFDYMLAGKPILQASDASNDLVTEAGCGFTVEPEDPAAFAGAVSRLRALSDEERRRLGDNGRRFVVEKHDCRVLAHRFLEAARGDDRPVESLLVDGRPGTAQSDLVQADGVPV